MFFTDLCNAFETVFRPDPLTWTMTALILFVLVTVCGYSRRYLAGDNNYTEFAYSVLLLGIGVLVMVSADQIWVMLAGWGISNLLLVKLMVHKRQWLAARNSGLLALKTFCAGFGMLTIAFWLLSVCAHTFSISAILSHSNQVVGLRGNVALLLIALAALTQSAIWPFHRWLISSLNSPTPVSALMHAGLVNGGGFLLVRFAPLYLSRPAYLYALFSAGLISAVLGTIWKLLQTDVKRMLACSTMGQMGFMVMQCGMGLFAPAISHLCWHGLFKAYLFLSSGSVVREKRNKNSFGGITALSFAVSCLFGAVGAYMFIVASGSSIQWYDTSCVMLALAFMASTQTSCSITDVQAKPARLVLALTASIVTGLSYGLSLRLIERILAPLGLLQPQPFNALYLCGFIVIASIWLAMNMNIAVRLQNTHIWKRLYMAALNSSQPHSTTVTTLRTTYYG